MDAVVSNQDVSSMGLAIRHNRASEAGQIKETLDNGIYEVNKDEIYGKQDEGMRFHNFNGGIGGKYFGGSIADGGTWFQLEKSDDAEVKEQVGGGDRGNVYGFSYRSRLRLLRALAKLNRSGIEVHNVIFATLTYSELTEKNKGISGREYKRHLKNITDSIIRKYGGFGVWRWELQKRLVGHWHLIWFGVEKICMDWIRKRWNEITNGTQKHFASGTRVERARNWTETALYSAKVLSYVAKDESTFAQRKHMKDIHIGRVWGIVNREDYKEHISLVDVDMEEAAYNEVIRTYRKLQKSWKFKGEWTKENYVAWKKQEHWFDNQCQLRNVKFQLFMENGEVMRLLAYANEISKSKLSDLHSGEWDFVGGFDSGIKSGFGEWSNRITEVYS